VRKSAALRRRITSYRHSLLSPGNAGKFVPLSADDKTMDGLNPSGVIIDELHRHRRGHRRRDAHGGRARANSRCRWRSPPPATTSKASAGSTTNIRRTCSRACSIDDTWFAYIAAADEEDDWTDERTWFKANPNLGVSKDLEHARRIQARAEPARGAARVQAPAPRHLERKRRRLDADGPLERERSENRCALKGRPCVAGVDLSATTDVTAYVELYLPTAADPHWHVRPFFWLPQAKIDAARRGEFGDLVRYDRWHDDGFVFATPGDVIDYDAVYKFVTERADAAR
jgi:phage terminase large subunit-like protein